MLKVFKLLFKLIFILDIIEFELKKSEEDILKILQNFSLSTTHFVVYYPIY